MDIELGVDWVVAAARAVGGKGSGDTSLEQ